jgi:cation diffusion facilitator family transporter
VGGTTNDKGNASVMLIESLSPHQALQLSVAAACGSVVLKWLAWWMTGSVGFLSDALDSLTNLAAALFALVMVAYARRPPDARYPYGYGKAEYFSSTIEGALITAAGIGILFAAGGRLLDPQPISSLGLGAALSIGTACFNCVVAQILIRVGRKHRSPATEGDGRHLMSDVYTTIGVVIGVGAAGLTNWNWLDPTVAILVALNLLRQGLRMVSLSLGGLMDGAFADEDIKRMKEGLVRLEREGGKFQGLRTRRAGANRFAFVELHVPAAWSVECADELARDAENTAYKHGIRLMVRVMPIAHGASESMPSRGGFP